VRFVAALSVTLAFIPGCQEAASNPKDVELPDGTTAKVLPGSGVSRLADSRWQICWPVGERPEPCCGVFGFGHAGNVETLQVDFDMRLPIELPPEVICDDTMHPIAGGPLSYRAACYSAQTQDGMGVGVRADVTMHAPLIGRVARATGSAMANLDENLVGGHPNPDATMHGTAHGVLASPFIGAPLPFEVPFSGDEINE